MCIRDRIPLLIDPKGESIELLKPDVVVDAIIAKKNLGTTITVSYTHLDVYKRQGQNRFNQKGKTEASYANCNHA